MSLLGRLSRLFAIPLVIAVLAGVFAVAGYTIAPHSERAITAVDFERVDVQFNLDVGGRRTLVYDRYGAQVSELRYGSSNREPVPLATVPPAVWQTVLAVEDEKFFEHHGVDLRGIGRALLSNVETGGISQGGSTLTQQIVKLLYVGDEQSITRKLREAFLAARIEEQYTKDELLEFYLNFIYFGNGAYGIQAAAETYFGKSAGDLDVGDAALLAGLIRSPSVFDGFSDVETARRRRGDSLQRAVDVGLITAAQMTEYDARPLPDRDLSPGQQFRRNYYLEEVQQELLEMPELGATETDRFNTVFGGGLRVFTAYDPILQRDMEASRAETFPAGLGEFQVSVATIDHRTGQVLAFLAGSEFAESQFNLATQGRRQPGSSFKTYVLAAAFELGGFQPNDVVAGNGPCQFDVGAREPYKVQNFGNSGGRVATVRSQTLASSNCAFVRLGLATGLDNVARMADALVGREPGDEFQPFPSMSLGAQEITPLEQAIGYGALANDGVRMEPYYVERIEDADGNVLFQRVPTGKRDREQPHVRTRRRHARGQRRGARDGRTGPTRQRPGCGWQDGHGAGLHQCMVRRLHAAADDRGLDGEPEGQRADAPGRLRRPGQHQRHRRVVPGQDVERGDGQGARRTSARGVPRRAVARSVGQGHLPRERHLLGRPRAPGRQLVHGPAAVQPGGRERWRRVHPEGLRAVLGERPQRRRQHPERDGPLQPGPVGLRHHHDGSTDATQHRTDETGTTVPGQTTTPPRTTATNGPPGPTPPATATTGRPAQ